MATATCCLSEDQFLCAICLDVFTDPATLPCGHNFCRTCIDQHWATETTCKCPYCKQVFDAKPDLRVNIFIAEMADQFRQSQLQSNRSSPLKTANPGEIFCDFCTHPKSRALKSCLVCRSSFCESHLEPHLTTESLKGHHLLEPQRNLGSEVEERTPLRTDAEIQERTTAKAYIKELEQEMSELRHGARTATMDWTNMQTYECTVERAMAQLDQKLGQRMSQTFSTDLQRVRKYTIYVELDPDKVHPKSTSQSNAKRSNDNRPECKCVLAGQSFSAGKFYFEVEVKSRSKWALGLAKELHVNREVALSPRNAYWAICRRNKSEWYAGAEPSMRLSLKSRLEKVGVFVDYEEGLVSFYDANQAGLIYRFTGCNFPHGVHPFFSPCDNDGVQLHTQPDSSCVLQ